MNDPHGYSVEVAKKYGGCEQCPQSPQEARERAVSRPSVSARNEVAEQEAADQAEERRVAREDEAWKAVYSPAKPVYPPRPPIPPYLFADERSQRRVEEEARQERPLDDYAAWTDQNKQLFR